MENSIKMEWFGGKTPPFWETPIFRDVALDVLWLYCIYFG